MIRLPAESLDRSERLSRVKAYLAHLPLTNYRAVIFGSVARGDFVAESDTDLLIISDDLPEDFGERLDLLFDARGFVPEIEPVGWRWTDWIRRRQEKDPFLPVLLQEGLWIASKNAATLPEGDRQE